MEGFFSLEELLQSFFNLCKSYKIPEIFYKFNWKIEDRDIA